MEQKNERQVLNCLMAVARRLRAAPVPQWVQLEREVDDPAPANPPPLPKGLDGQVRAIAAALRVQLEPGPRAGSYCILPSRKLIFVRLLQHHVVVRVGGGWDPLENYLYTHVSANAALADALALPTASAARDAEAALRKRQRTAVKPAPDAPAMKTLPQGHVDVSLSKKKASSTSTSSSSSTSTSAQPRGSSTPQPRRRTMTVGSPFLPRRRADSLPPSTVPKPRAKRTDMRV